jgi:IS5 family transposase
VAVGLLPAVVDDDLDMQGRSDDQRELLDAESVAGHLLRANSVFAFLGAHRGELFPEEMFADLFPTGRGRPSVPAEVMASVITLQALHGLSDNETVDAVTFDLRWKAACGLAVTAAAFHSTTLTYWRRRLAASQYPDRIFDAVKAVVAQTGALLGRTRRALDSTVLDDAVATQDTVTQLIGAIRRVGREVPGAGDVIAAHCTAHDYDDPGKPAIAWDDAAAREALVDGLVSDAHRLLGYLPEQDLGPRAAEAVALLALVAGQDVEPVEGSDGSDGHWRIAERVIPDRVISTVDPEARHAHKSVQRRQDGFKAHVAVEPDTGIITACALTKAGGRGADGEPVSESHVGMRLLAEEIEPARVLADSAYGSGELRTELAARGHVDLIKPAPLRPAVPGGFTVDDFVVDHSHRTVTCPAGVTRTLSRTGLATFKAACRTCLLRPRCTTRAEGKSLKVHSYDALLRQARRCARNPNWHNEYRQYRPLVERAIAWLTRGNRKLRYRGVARNNQWLHHRVAALNLRRLIILGLHHTGTNWAIA